MPPTACQLLNPSNKSEEQPFPHLQLRQDEPRGFNYVCEGHLHEQSPDKVSLLNYIYKYPWGD